MKKTAIFILSFSLVLITGCTTIKKGITGFKTPETENPESIRNYLLENDVTNQNIWAIESLSSWNDLMSYTRMPNIFFFTKEGTFLNPENDKECLNDVESFVMTLQDMTAFPSTDKSLDYFASKAKTLEGGEISLSTDKDYYAVILWAKFGDKYMIDKIKYWENILAEKDNIKTILFDLDEQSFWED